MEKKCNSRTIIRVLKNIKARVEEEMQSDGSRVHGLLEIENYERDVRCAELKLERQALLEAIEIVEMRS